MSALDSILDALRLEPDGPDRYRAPNVDLGHAVVFGGQLLAQSIVAARIGQEEKLVKTLHTVFARGAAPDRPVEIEVDRMSAGRSIGTCAVTISQEGRLCTRSLVLLSAAEPDFIRHSDDHPTLPDLPPRPDRPLERGEWAIEVVGGVDISDPDAVGPPELDVWTCFPGAPEDAALDQALLSFPTDGFLIGAAMRPHAGVGQAQAHVTISTGVISHTLTFHDPCPAGDWFLMAQRSVHAGGGRAYGTAHVYRQDGRLAASFVQDSMIRPKTGSGSL
ncbi:MAG TPA: acyl-CoA thioesterase domain-containing protein [Acidimicrobiales bacterium]|nr:acyl-CoA thioesterase domain-containing protein [Acidimicrobiales bacterium]